MLTARPTPAGRMGRADKGISAPFGYSAGYQGGRVFHHGQDYYWLNADPAGSRKVFAAGAGTVSRVYWDSTMGGCIEINHGSFITRSCHMPQGSSAVGVGQAVTTNTYLGAMGNAGTAAGGQYHLHFEVWVGGTRVDPEPYFRSLAPNQRVVVSPAGANVRSGPSTSSGIVTVLKGGTIVTLLGYEYGAVAAGSNVWLKHSAGYSHITGFTDQGLHDLPNLTPAPPVVEPPVEEPEPPVIEPEPPVEEPEPPVEEPDEPELPPEDDPVPPVESPPTPPRTGFWGLVLGAVVAGVAGLIALAKQFGWI